MNTPIDPRTALPPPPPPPPPTPPPRRAADPRGSLGVGFGLAWLVVVVGNVLALFLLGMSNGGSGALTLLALPWLGTLGLIVWFAVNGKPRTASGVAIGLATVVAVAVLLVAACFSLFATSFH